MRHGAADGVSPTREGEHRSEELAGRYDRRVVPVAGHFLPRETPEEVVRALKYHTRGPG